MNITMNDLRIVQAKYGLLVVYGKTMQACAPYLTAIKTIQHLCQYAQAHNLLIIYASTYQVKGLAEYILVKWLIQKYHVKGHKKDMPDGFPLIL